LASGISIAFFLAEFQWERQSPRPEVRAGRRGGFGSVSVLPAGARPYEGVAVALLVIEEVGVNRRVERGIIQLDGEVVAALGGPLRPGGVALPVTPLSALRRISVKHALTPKQAMCAEKPAEKIAPNAQLLAGLVI
jgi:hypothetical protein